jgi:osmotically-inducible protein OsmY
MTSQVFQRDERIREDVVKHLHWQPGLDIKELEVTVHNGIASLCGTVGSSFDKLRAEMATREVKGVLALVVELKVAIKYGYERTDDELAEAVLLVLKNNTAVPYEQIRVKVEQGVVTLEGHVEWEFQRNATAKAVIYIRGVREVISLILVSPKIMIRDVWSEISSALHRTASIDAERIHITVDGSHITLRGKVRSSAEKEDAEHAAWCTPGVTHVDSFLQVESELMMIY